MKKRIFIGIFLAAAFGLLIFIHILYNHKNQTNECTSKANLAAPIEIPDSHIHQHQQAVSGKPEIVMFYVDWCTFCRRFMPIFGEAASKYNKDFDFTVVNCEHPENAEIVKEFDISGYPTVMIIDNDLDFQYQVTMAATQSLEALEKELNNHKKLRSKLAKK